jgi:hydrogenase 3 maturation protease
MGKNAKPKQGTGLSRKGAPQDWRRRLARELRAARRLFVLGVGNPDLADDGAGSLCVRLLQRKMADHRRLNMEEIKVFDGGEVPESATGLIREFRPTHVLIIDAAAAGRRPGTIFFISQNRIPEEDLTTHRLPLSQLVHFLEESVGCRVTVLGIEPGDASWGRPGSPAVKRAVKIIAGAIEKGWLSKTDDTAHRRPRPEAH